ncbi:DUF3861 domain-containing protein [Flavobacterium sp. RHBU_24]|uniref:DUF3861 domain-containing protein n=1 Tax=Flavobacterium sp. RHBU_24 TaxID=3391185 RepID=UPI00398569F9
MNKNYNHYKITLEHIHSPKSEDLHRRVEVVFDNHDNLFNTIDMLQDKDLFNDMGQSTEFAIGLKMFGEVLLKNKDNALFEEFFPAFKDFMKKLKGN